MSNPPMQDDVDAVASYIEACEELDREPFYGPDEKLGIRHQGKVTTFTLGDRFHFRSALISFRRVWMPSEPSHVQNVAQIIRLSGAQASGFLDYHLQQIKSSEFGPRTFGKLTLTGHRIIELWLNTVFAHGGIKGKNKRADFEAAVAAGGHAHFEYAFRSLIHSIGIEYRNISKLVAKPTLAHWVKQGFNPSFRIGSAFGIKRRELTSEGHVIVRQGSSEFFSEESFEQRFERILHRHIYEELKFLFRQLDMESAALVLAVLRSPSIETLLNASGVEVRLVERMPLELPAQTPELRGSTGVTPRVGGIAADPTKWTRANFFEGPVMETDALGMQYLGDSFVHFKNGLVKE